MTERPAPVIPGLSFVRRLGAGGYADVYLYEQALPARRVAVKVLRDSDVARGVAQRFRSEANAMAQLEHPHIVPVYATGSTADGRPYLVMMYYPRASLAERVKAERLTVPEALRIGIQLSSAVETAHRAGLLHRDIKPANVLTSQYGTPGLTDFGIAAEVSEADDTDTGVSVPWSPPEVLYVTAPATARSDVYSLAATVWHLLVGRSPFEQPGRDNSHYALMKRIRDQPVPDTGRPDVPASLERLLKAGLAKDPGLRPASAMLVVASTAAWGWSRPRLARSAFGMSTTSRRSVMRAGSMRKRSRIAPPSGPSMARTRSVPRGTPQKRQSPRMSLPALRCSGLSAKPPLRICRASVRR